jgi:hypothetical protein
VAPTIRDNLIIKYGVSESGDLCRQRGNSLNFEQQIISNTIITLEGDTTSAGGGIYVASGHVDRDNTVLSNTAQTEGGGIYIGWNVPL